MALLAPTSKLVIITSKYHPGVSTTALSPRLARVDEACLEVARLNWVVCDQKRRERELDREREKEKE